MKGAGVENEEEAGKSSSGGMRTSDLADPLVVPPLSSAPPTDFARMASVSLGSEDDVDGARLVT